MKKLTALIVSIIAMLAVATGVYAAETVEADPLTEYVRNGIVYSVQSENLKELNPGYWSFLQEVYQKIYGEGDNVRVYAFTITPEIDLRGFVNYCSDGSRAIYLNKNISYAEGVMIFVHESVHYKYHDEIKNVFYTRRFDEAYSYKKLMEEITDVIASEEYKKLDSPVEYVKAYSNEILDTILKEDNQEILVSLYKGEIKVSCCYKRALERALDELQGAENLEEGRKAFCKIRCILTRAKSGK